MNQLLNGKQKSSTKSGNYEAKNSHSAMGFHQNDLSLPDIGDMSDLKSHRDVIQQHLEMLDYSKIIVPVNIGVKYRPPKIGIEFYLQNDEAFNRSLNSKRNSFESVLINDSENYSHKLLVHEIPLDSHFFTKEA